MLEFRRLELVKAGLLAEDEHAFTYHTAADLGLVSVDAKSEVFQFATVCAEEKHAAAST